MGLVRQLESRVKSARSLNATSVSPGQSGATAGGGRISPPSPLPPPVLLDSCRTPSQKATTCYKFSLKRLLLLILIVAAKFTARWPGAGWRKTDYFLLLFFFSFLLTSLPSSCAGVQPRRLVVGPHLCGQNEKTFPPAYMKN